MRKLFILFSLLLPHLIVAQNVQTLKYHADSLRKLGKVKKAEKLYNQAIARVLTYKERVSDYEWLSLSLAEHENKVRLTQKNGSYVSFQYGNNGPVLKEKIKLLNSQHAKFIFTYYEWLSLVNAVDMVRDSVSGKYVGFDVDNKRLLVWVKNDNIYFQQFSSSNFYGPLVIHNDTLRNLLINHGEVAAHEKLTKLRFKLSESPFAVFEFRNRDENNEQRISDPKYLVDPNVNNKSYLSQLFPLIWNESRKYYANVSKSN